MKFLSVFLFACVSAAWAQATPAAPAAPPMPNLPDQTVVAVFDDGTNFTMADFKKYMAVLPPQMQQMAARDRKTFLQQWGFFRKLSSMAEKAGLDQKSPTKEALEYSRMYVLSQAQLNDYMLSLPVDPALIPKFYDGNKERFKQVKVSVIYVAFGDSAGKKSLSEQDAKAKAEKLAAQIRAGADFVKLVKENSDDEASRAKDGDFGTLRRADNMPDAIRSAVFALKQGEVSDPVRQPNGFYLLRSDEVTYRPLADVRDEIYEELKQNQYRKWLEETNSAAKVTFPNPAFLATQTPAAPPAPAGK